MRNKTSATYGDAIRRWGFSPAGHTLGYGPAGTLFLCDSPYASGEYWAYFKQAEFAVNMYRMSFKHSIKMNYRNPQHISIALYEAAQGISQCAGRDLEPGCTSVYTGNGSEFEAYCQRDSFTKAISITVSPEYYHDHLEPHFGTLDERRADLARADGRIDIPELASLYRHVRAYRGIGETADTFYRQAVVQAFEIVFAAASRIASHPSILSDEDAELIDSLRAYISANLESDLSCGTLATRAYIGQTKLKRLFKTRTGLAPNAYVTAQRMEHAEDLLSTTRLSIEEISERVGYRSAAAFSAAFRRAYGSSPSQIR